MRKCEVCGKKVKPRTMKVYVLEHTIRPFLNTKSYYCTDCTRCGAQIILKEKFDGVVVTPSESGEKVNDK